MSVKSSLRALPQSDDLHLIQYIIVKITFSVCMWKNRTVWRLLYSLLKQGQLRRCILEISIHMYKLNKALIPNTCAIPFPYILINFDTLPEEISP